MKISQRCCRNVTSCDAPHSPPLPSHLPTTLRSPTFPYRVRGSVLLQSSVLGLVVITGGQSTIFERSKDTCTMIHSYSNSVLRCAERMCRSPNVRNGVHAHGFVWGVCTRRYLRFGAYRSFKFPIFLLVQNLIPNGNKPDEEECPAAIRLGWVRENSTT